MTTSISLTREDVRAPFSDSVAFADQNQLIHFFKNVTMAGGLSQIVAFGGGRISLDARRN